MSNGHPDIQALHDWPMYGPKDPRIADLVRELALDHGLRLEEIETIIEAALRAKLQQLQNAQRAANCE